ncbi:MAG: hypothetical protein ACI9KN_001374 [Gammaproteobacteria bacterium]|jgi:hypothetical protein
MKLEKPSKDEIDSRSAVAEVRKQMLKTPGEKVLSSGGLR